MVVHIGVSLELFNTLSSWQTDSKNKLPSHKKGRSEQKRVGVNLKMIKILISGADFDVLEDFEKSAIRSLSKGTRR